MVPSSCGVSANHTQPATQQRKLSPQTLTAVRCFESVEVFFLGTTNGIEVSTDNNILYVGESIQKKIWAYDLNAKGEISNKRLFKKFNNFGIDGMRCDKKGNLYIARYGAGLVVVLNSKGLVIRTIKLSGDKPTNVAFGGINGDIVYVTMQGRKWVESFVSKYPGRNF